MSKKMAAAEIKMALERNEKELAALEAKRDLLLAETNGNAIRSLAREIEMDRFERGLLTGMIMAYKNVLGIEHS